VNLETGDLGPNARRLYDRIRVLPFEHIRCVDVGVRDGVSSRVMLEAVRGRGSVIGIDASEIGLALARDPDYFAIQQCDSVTALSTITDEIHAAWIDTLHIAHQAALEAALVWSLMPVGGVIGFHDTHWPAGKCDHYCGRDWPTADHAVKWLFVGEDYALVEEFPESWGAMFVTKLKDEPLKLHGVTWQEIVDGRNTLLDILPDNVAKARLTPELLRLL
jgi:hypothetical protein